MYSILLSATQLQLQQLSHYVALLPPDHYTQPQPLLGQSTLGQHLRHILEFYQTLHTALATRGPVSYDARSRDLLLEQNPQAAQAALAQLQQWPLHHLHLPTTLVANPLTADNVPPMEVPTTYAREWLYVYEHALHHMALLKVPVQAGSLPLQLPEDFGVAPSTMRHRAQLRSA